MMTDTVRYDFGRNWSEFSASIDEEAQSWAREELARLAGELNGVRFLDIGCGSGLHSLAALQLGAAEVIAFDYDPQSVATTRRVLEAHSAGRKWTVRQGDILDLDTSPSGERFDIVYSWGVLHHTGSMWRAIENASRYVADEGLLIIALYKKTKYCEIWRKEKKIYSQMRWIRPVLYWVYSSACIIGLSIRGRNPVAYIRNYNRSRGMSFWHDVDDWLGGYPYESVSPPELEGFVAALGFTLERSFNTHPMHGLFGSGCGEWVFKRTGAAAG